MGLEFQTFTTTRSVVKIEKDDLIEILSKSIEGIKPRRSFAGKHKYQIEVHHQNQYLTGIDNITVMLIEEEAV